MDPLSDILALLKPRSFLTAGFDAGGDWAVRFGDQAGQIKCYVVISGGCMLSVEGIEQAVRLAAGDCFVLPTGRSFTLGSETAITPLDANEVFAQQRENGVIVHNGGGDLFLLGSRFEVDGRHSTVLLRTLPPILHLSLAADQTALRWSIERMQAEMSENRPGSSLVAHHLAQMMLVQALRLSLSQGPGDGPSWFFALSDPQLSLAIGAIHEAPARRWTLGELADCAGMSRSVFAQRFREKVGETPITYLTRWRMMLAGEKLATTHLTLAQVALAVGYDSENAFSSAFKRVMGAAPRRYARSETARRIAHR